MNWKSFAIVLAACGCASAQFPVQDMNSYSLGLGYTLGLRGQDITSASIPSHEVIHMVSLAYAPAPYVALQAGVGLDRLHVDSYNQIQFKGGYGISPSFGLSLFTPFLADLLRFTGGAQFLYLNSEDNRGFRYSGFIFDPSLGLIVSPSTLVDLTLGARMHFIDGTMTPPRGREKQPFSNGQIVKGYAAVTVKTPFEGAFMTLDLDMSPSVRSDWSDGPSEASVGVSFGAVLGSKRRANPSGEKSKYFPAYSEMKDKQDKMAEEVK